MAQNLLRSSQSHFTLIEIATGQNKNGESLLTSDLVFEIDVEPQGLNDKASTQTIVIPRDKVMDSSKTAAELVKEISN